MSEPSRRRLGNVRGLVLDIEPLRRHADYRRLWTGQAINVVGSMITRVALPYQVYVLTGSTLALAGLTFVQLVPLLLFTLGGGAIADAFDRRRVLIVTQLGLASTSVAFILISIQPQPSVPLLFEVAFISSAFFAIDWPTRGSVVPRLVPPERLRAAIALGQLSFNAGSVIGPLIAGLVLGAWGAAGAYALDVATYAVSLAMLLGIQPIPPIGARVRLGLATIREGLGFVRRRRLILSTFAIDLDAMVFGSPRTLFPVLALDVFKTGAVGVGLLNAAPAAGAFAAIIFSGGVSKFHRIGRGIILAVAAWGAAILLFGLATGWFAAALLFLAVAGGADVVSAVLRSSVVQFETPDELRGRVQAIHTLVVVSGPQVGDIEAAVVASAIGAQLSVISGGLLCLVGVVAVARWFPELVGATARTELATLAPPATAPG